MTRHPIRRRILQLLGATAALGVLGVAVIGFAHTETGRPLLQYIPGMGACPLGPPLSAEDRMRVRGELLAPLAGVGAATSRRVLAFELGRTSAADVSAWAASHAIQCAPGRKIGLRCTAVPADALGQTHAFDEVSFEFDAGDRLISVEGSANLQDAAVAIDYVATRDLALRDQLGEPTASRDTALAGPLSQMSRDFRRSDIRAHVNATNMGRGRYKIREFHQLIEG
jgi:hypothetical protein